MNALTNNYFFWVALIMVLLTLYILPTLIAAIRGTENLGWVIVINLLPTGIGWLAALIAAIWLPRRVDETIGETQTALPGSSPRRGPNRC